MGGIVVCLVDFVVVFVVGVGVVCLVDSVVFVVDFVVLSVVGVGVFVCPIKKKFTFLIFYDSVNLFTDS